MRDFHTLEEMAQALREFSQRYNDHWLLERLHFQSPRQARQRLPHDHNSKNRPRNRGRYMSELERAIRDYVAEDNRRARPFVWTASASQIIRKVRHCKQALVTGH